MGLRAVGLSPRPRWEPRSCFCWTINNHSITTLFLVFKFLAVLFCFVQTSFPLSVFQKKFSIANNIWNLHVMSYCVMRIFITPSVCVIIIFLLDLLLYEDRDLFF